MLTCKQCGNTWFPRVENPQRCPDPSCQSRNWNKDLEDLKVEELQEIYDKLIQRQKVLHFLTIEVRDKLGEAIQKQVREQEELLRLAEESGLKKLADEAEAELQHPTPSEE